MKTYSPELYKTTHNLIVKDEEFNYIQTKEEILSRINNMLVSTSTKKIS